MLCGRYIPLEAPVIIANLFSKGRDMVLVRYKSTDTDAALVCVEE